VAAGAEPDTWIVVEHEPTVTMGRNAKQQNLHGSAEWLAAQGVALHQIERGGEATYHGPGQVVVYPIMKLPRFREVVPLVRALEGAVIAALADFGITAERWPAHAGVWVDDRCICAIGLSVKQMTSFHGIALNASTALDYDRLITPCGLPDRGITSLSHEIGRREPGRTISWTEARDALLPRLAEAFDLRFEPSPAVPALAAAKDTPSQ
jgi:lipoate-protein ligase B